MRHIRKVLSGVFRSVVILPLTAGNMLDGNRNRPIHDGRISVIAIVGCLISIMLVILYVCMHEPKHKYIPVGSVKIVLSTMVSIGLVTMIVLFVHYWKNKQIVTSKNSTENRNQLKIKFLWLFGIMSNVFNGLSIWWYAECLTTHQNENFKHIVNIIYNGLLVVFNFIQIVFICYFSNFCFIGSVASHYAILFLLVANGSTWLFCFLQVSSSVFKTPVLNNTFVFHDMKSNESYNYHCIRNGSSFEHFLQNAKPILYPGSVAFPLLSVSMLISIWCASENLSTPVNEVENSDKSRYIELTSDFAESDIVMERHKFKFLRNHSMSYYATIVAGIALLLPYILGSILLVNSYESSLYEMWQFYKMTFKVLILFFGLVAFYKLITECRPKAAFKPLEGNEYILFFSAFADAMFHTFGLLAAALISPSKDISEYTARLMFVENIVNLLIDYFQTVLIIQAGRYEKKVRNNLNWPIENTCFLLCILNLGQWTIDNFTIYYYCNATKLQAVFYGTRYWERLMNFVFPIAVFFRFQSFMGMYLLYYTFKNI